ncbi:MAG: esterase [Rhodospirillaceae bacterium]|nr:esterase [Rhodospirillaceae bacterium]|tara:strand:- start:41853 stop:42713 length:861 start_codon:yes stop_codon:yes gene_type:complete
MSKVYRDMDQEALDIGYNARATVDDFDGLMEAYVARSKAARNNLDCREDVPYGNHVDEVVDVFPAGANSPIFIFIHGGYWRLLSQKESASMAPGFAANGVTLVTVNYSLAPVARLDLIVDQCRRALVWVYENAASFGGDPNKIFVGGSSAGGHLTGMLVSGGWHNEFGVPADIVKGAVPLSGLFDLEPIRLSLVNEWMQLDPESVKRNSPMQHLPEKGCPLIVSYGETETAEFKRQSADYAAAWRASSGECNLFESVGRSHFDVIFDLDNPDTRLGQAVLNLISES